MCVKRTSTSNSYFWTHRAGARHSTTTTRSAAACRCAAAQHESCSQQQHRTTLESNRRRVRNEERGASNTTPGDTPAAGGAWGLEGKMYPLEAPCPRAVVPRRSSKVESTAIGIPCVNSPRSITIYATRTSHNKQHHSHHDPTTSPPLKLQPDLPEPCAMCPALHAKSTSRCM